MRRLLALVVLCLLAAPALALADWNRDDRGDVLAVASDGRLLLYTGAGDGTFVPGGGQPIGAGWSQFTAIVAPGDFSGDGAADLLARTSSGELLLYRGTGTGGFVSEPRPVVGRGWNSLDVILTPGDWNGDGHVDLLARAASDGRLLLYRGTGAGGFVAGGGVTVGTGWAQFTGLVAPGDFSGDGASDVLARTSGGELLLYRGDGTGGFRSGNARVGAGWQQFTALLGGDFNGDGAGDVLARRPDGALLRYAGDGDGGFANGAGTQIGSGWQSLSSLMLVGGTPPPPTPVPTPAPTPPVTPPQQTSELRLQTGLACTPAGGRVKVSLRVRRPPGKRKARVRKIVFFVKGGQKKADRKAPYRVRLRAKSEPGSPLRVYARVVFKRPGSKKLRRQTVSRKYTICA